MVVRRGTNNSSNATRWVCHCDCGAKTLSTGASLRCADSRSCGCLMRERMSAATKISARKHGMAHSPEHDAWRHMKQRCFNSNTQKYELWGGRGITVCQKWVDSFEAFFADMGARPSPTYSLDRIDNDGNYEPSNCRWATRKEQRKNRRNPKLLLGENSGASRRLPGPRTRNRS